MCKKTILLFICITVLLCTTAYILPRFSSYHLPLHIFSKKERPDNLVIKKIQTKSAQLIDFCQEHHYNTSIAFFIDMSLPSGQNRFFVVDLEKDSILDAGLVTHGSCGEIYLENVRFSNTPGSECSSKGRYKIGHHYKGRFGDAWKLHGLDKTNNNAFERAVVLHSHSCVPTTESGSLQSICNSFGCPTVAPAYLKKLQAYLNNTKKPIVLEIYE